MRKYTIKLFDMVDDGLLDAKEVLRNALNYMSEADVQDFMESEGYVDEEDDV